MIALLVIAAALALAGAAIYIVRRRRETRLRSRLPTTAHQLNGPYRRTRGRK